MGYEGAAGAIRTLVPAPSRRGKSSIRAMGELGMAEDGLV